ncbi:MAG: DUF1501 domain-containing protein [Planctomycetota bacterium]|nr:DUF1501 domain-containing protein [Planctomycetota bacterium]
MTIDRTRRNWMKTTCGAMGLSLADYLGIRSGAANEKDGTGKLPGSAGNGKAKSVIVLFCWGGISHLDSWDLKPDAPADIRGPFRPIATSVPGIQVGEHLPLLASQVNQLAIVRSVHHDCSAHGKGMYWNMTGHQPPQPGTAANLPPSGKDWPSLGAMVSKFKRPPDGFPASVRLPYPLVDNGTLQAGEYGGWLSQQYDPIVVKTPDGRPFGGVSRSLGAAELDLSARIDRVRFGNVDSLIRQFDRPVGASESYRQRDHFRDLASAMLVSNKVREAFDLNREPEKIQRAYGDHICGRSILLARRLSEAGIPLVTVCCAAGDLNGAKGDHWDTHGDNFNRLQKTMLPAFDRPASVLLKDLQQRGTLDETLVVFLTEFGRTPKINGGAGRDHFPNCYSVCFAGAGIEGGQVYGKSDRIGSEPDLMGCRPNDLHATIFQALGISLQSTLHDQLGRPFQLTDGKPLPIFS